MTHYAGLVMCIFLSIIFVSLNIYKNKIFNNNCECKLEELLPHSVTAIKALISLRKNIDINFITQKDYLIIKIKFTFRLNAIAWVSNASTRRIIDFNHHDHHHNYRLFPVSSVQSRLLVEARGDRFLTISLFYFARYLTRQN